jgi:hypothetical protein
MERGTFSRPRKFPTASLVLAAVLLSWTFSLFLHDGRAPLLCGKKRLRARGRFGRGHASPGCGRRPPLLAHPPCAPHRCSTWQFGERAIDLARGDGGDAWHYSEVVALLEAELHGSGRAEDKQLFDAAKDDDTAEVTRLLAAGADPNGCTDAVRACARAASLPAVPAPPPAPLPAARHSPPAPRRRRTSQICRTALIWASRNGNTAIAQALLGAGADLHAKTEVRPPRRRPAPAAARRRSLIRRVRRTAASLSFRPGGRA